MRVLGPEHRSRILVFVVLAVVLMGIVLLILDWAGTINVIPGFGPAFIALL